jgi:hypothetical protein
MAWFYFNFKEINVILWERTICMHHNRGNLTVGMKNETVEIVGIIFPRPLPQNLPFWE